MPRSGQIVPEYLTPHVKTYINDNSIFTSNETTQIENGVRLLTVFASAKGEDGVIKPITSISDYLEEYGTPNFNLYGQPCYMPYAALRSGNAKCYCMRVMPQTATYANVVISAYTQVAENAETGARNFKVKFVATPVSNITNKETMSLKMQEIASYPPQEVSVRGEQYNVFPLFSIISKGRGQYGNAYRIRMVSDNLMNQDNNYTNYIFEVLDSSSGSVILKEQHRGGFNYDAIVDNDSLLFDDVIGNPELGSKKIEFVTNIDGFLNMYETYKEFVTTELQESVADYTICDMLSGKTKTGASMPGYFIDSTAIDFAALDSTIGIALGNGDDSTFAANYTPIADADGNPGVTRQQAIDDAYIKAFNGDFDSSIRSKRSVPCELILDANYSEEVKLKLAELALHRYDARCILDAGILTTVSAAHNWITKENIKSVSDCIISKECQHYKIRDPFTGRVIPVTTTYYFAEQLPTHYRVVGNHIPFVGERYAQISSHVRNSLKPAIDADNLEVKEALYTNHCNFFECIAEDNFVRGTQSTSQITLSDLSEENNVAVMLEMKRMLEEFVSGNLFNFSEAEDRLRFTEDATRMFADFRGSKVNSFEVYFDMNAFEAQRSILHCYLSVVFRGISKRGIIEIDINKRT